MTTTQVRNDVERAADLARAEKASEEIYGSDWWDLTRFLGNLPDNRREVAKVYTRISEILEVSSSYLSTRRSLARKIDPNVYRTRMYYKLPPRVTLEWSSVSGRDAVLDSATAKALIAFEKEGRSLREIYDLLPDREKPKSWQNATERAQAEEQIRQEALRPENVAAAIRENPVIRRAIVADTDTRVALAQEHNEYARQQTADIQFHPERDDKHNQFLQTADIATKIANMSRLADDVRRLLRDHATDAETRSTYAGSLAKVQEKIEEMIVGLRSDAEFESMLVREGLVP